MIRGISTFCFTMCLSLPTSSLAAKPKSFEQLPNLKKYLSILEEVAAGGPSLGYFALTDGDRIDILSADSCQKVGKGLVVKDFKNMTKTVLNSGDKSAINLPKTEFEKLQGKAIKEFEQMVSRGNYSLCQKTVAEKRSISVINQYRSDKYIFQWELGWED